jgi:hypothetical protein
MKSLWNDEQGVGLILLFALVLIIVYFCALVIDLRRAEYVVETISFSADAAALAAASELSLSSGSDLTRWTNAKRAVLAFVKKNAQIADYTFPDPAESAHRYGDPDSCESSGNYRWQIYDNDEMRIEIERGIYEESKTAPFTSSFASLENSVSCYVSAAPAKEPFPNAVRVTITVYNYPNYFALVRPFNSPSFARLSGTAMSARVE